MATKKTSGTIEESHYDFGGVRFTPAVLHFKDVYEDPVILNFTVQNMKNVPVVIRMQEPLSMGFKILSETREMKLCPGMRLSRNVKYRGIKKSVLESSLTVFVDGTSWSYPIKVSKAEGCVKVEPPEVDFGIVDVGQSVVTRTLKLKNEGALANKFAFDLGKNDLDLVVRPLRGVVYERTTVNVTFEFVALKPGYLRSECWLRLFPEVIRIPICVMVYMPQLDVHHPNSVDDFTLLEFPPTYYNTECSQCAIIHNMSAGITSFVILAEINNHLMLMREAKNIRSEFKMFSVNPYEGRMESFEGRLCTVMFRPSIDYGVKGWKHERAANSSEDYLAFMQLIRVQCLDKVELENLTRSREKEDSSSYILDDSGLITTFDVTSLPQRARSDDIEYPKLEKTMRRLCLHGTAILPDLAVEPSELILGLIPVGETKRRVLCLHNRCPHLPINFQQTQLICVRVEPSNGSIGPQQKIEVLVIAKPRSLGAVKQRIEFILYGKIEDGSMREIGKKKVSISWEGVQKKKVNEPKFNMGITPQITNEVGIFTDGVTFASPVKKPRAAVLCADISKKRVWFPKTSPLPKARVDESSDSAEKVKNLIRTETQYLEKLPQMLMKRHYSLRVLSSQEIEDILMNNLFKTIDIVELPPNRLDNVSDCEDLDENVLDGTPPPVVPGSLELHTIPGMKLYNETTGEETDTQLSRSEEGESIESRETRYSISMHSNCCRSTGSKPSVKVSRKSINYPSIAGESSGSSDHSRHSICNPSVESKPSVKGSRKSISYPSIAGESSRCFNQSMHSSCNQSTGSKVSSKSINCLSIAAKSSSSPLSTEWLQSDTSGDMIVRDLLWLTLEEMEKQQKPKPWDDLIAFPNDRSRSLRPWPKDKRIRTIFTGKTRYSAPQDPNYVFSEEKQRIRAIAAEHQLNFMRGYGKLRTLKMSPTPALPEYEGRSDDLLYKLLQMPTHLKEVELLDKTIPCGEYVPLTPLQVYNVKIEPRTINFGKVTPSSVSYEMLHIENHNTFPVAIRLIPGTRGVALPDGEMKIIKASGFCSIKMSFTASSLGRYNGFLVYVINNNHTFEVTMMADVVPKCFQLSSTSLEFNTASGCKFLPVSVINKLHSPSNFKWTIPEGSAFHVEPLQGCVPALCYIQCAVSYTLRPDQWAQESGLKLYSESGMYQFLKCSITTKKASNVSLSANRVDLGNIPLNMFVSTFTLLLNDSQQDYTFKIKSLKAFPGLSVFPQKGILRAFSCTPIHVHCRIPNIMEFSREIKVDVQRSKSLSFTVAATVCYPKITVKPQSIALRRLPAGSHVVIPLEINNAGTTIASLEFQLDDRPEYFITQSADLCTGKTGHVSSCIVSPQKNQCLYLHFKPMDIAAHKFILPIVINDLLGPSVAGNMASQRTSFFMKTTGFADAKVKLQPIPKDLPLVRLDITVSGRLLRFSANFFKFSYFPDSVKNKTMQELEISNAFTQTVTFSFCLRELDENISPFRINWRTDNNGNGTEQKMYFTLQPSESMLFLLFFDPYEPGHYTANIPIYINNCNDENIFDVIHLDGKYPAPLLWTSAKEIFFLPVPLEVYNESEFTLYALNYSEQDYLSIKMKPKIKESLNVFFPSGHTIPVNDKPYGITVRMIFESEMPMSFSTEVTFYDSKSRSCTVHVTVAADNSILTTYSYMKYGFQYSVDDYGDVKKNITALKRTTPPYYEETSIATADTGSFTELSDASGLSKSNFSIKNILSQSVTDLRSDVELRTFFPVFPLPTDESENAYFLRSTLQAAECWLHLQGFNNTFAPSLPTDITLVLSSMPLLKKTKTRGKGRITSRTIFHVVGNLGGPRVAKLFQISKYPEDENQFVAFVCDLYRRLLGFLTEQGACLAHVSPEHMLSYQEYVLYMRKVHRCKPGHESNGEYHKTTTELLDLALFQGRSTQAWLDVTLQIYKTMVLSRIVLNLEVVPNKESVKADGEDELTEDLPLPAVEVPIPAPSQEYSVAECTLLAWLNAHFEAQRSVLWMKTPPKEHWPGCVASQQIPLASREIRNFESDLADGLVFAAVTASYCPYLIAPYLAHMFVEPTQREQAYHNAIRVVLAWQSMGLGFSLSPDDITKPNSIKMLMLTAHLYESLPMLCPRTRLKFYAELNGEATQRITVSNPCGKRLKYGILFLGEDEGFFSASKNNIVIPAHENAWIEIIYSARRIDPVKATLILSGCVYPPNFGRSITFQLEGYASSLKPVDEIEVKLPIYSPQYMELQFNSPYDTPGVWDIHVSERQPLSAGTFTPVFWKDQCTRKVPRRLFLHSEDLTIVNGEEPSLDVTIACLSPVVRKYWLVFMNATVGDFIIKLTVEPQALEEAVTIPVPLPEDIECRCGQQETPPNLDQGNFCPLVVGVPIPCRNGALWDAVLTMFKLTMDDRERNFWERYLETKIGVKLMKWLLGETYDSVTDEIIHVFNKTVKYQVSSNDDVTIPKIFTISDVWDHDTVALPVHVSSNIKDGSTVNINLTSQDRKEVRAYSIVLVGPKTESKMFATEMTLPALMLLVTLVSRTESYRVSLEYDIPTHQNETVHTLLDLLDPVELEKSQEIQYDSNFRNMCSDFIRLRGSVNRQNTYPYWVDVCNASLKLNIPVLPSDNIESILRALKSWDFRLRDLKFDALHSINAYMSSGNLSLALKATNLTSEYLLSRNAWISDMHTIQLRCPQVHFSDSTVVQNRSRDLRNLSTKMSIVTSFYSVQQNFILVLNELARNKAIDAHDSFFNSSEYELRISRLRNCSIRLSDVQFTIDNLENVTINSDFSYTSLFPWAAKFLPAMADGLEDLRNEVKAKINSLEKQLTTGIVFRDYVDRIVYTIMAIFGLTWNAALLHILTRYKDTCTPPNIILFNFAIIDILNLSIKMPCYYITKYYSPTLYIGVNACRTFVSFRVTVLYAIKFSVLTLSAQRYAATITTSRITSCCALSARPRAILLTLSVWLGAIVFGVPPGIFYHFSSDVCIAQVAHPSAVEVLDIFYIIFSCIVLPIPIAAFSLLTARRLRRSVRLIPGAENQSSARIRSARVVTAIAVVFVVTQIPRSFWFCYAAYFHINRRKPLLFYIDVVVVYLFYLNSCLNPVALYIASSELRRRFNSIFFWWWWRRKLTSSISLRRTATSALTNFT